MSGDLAAALRNAGKAIGAGEPVVAVLEGPGGMGTYGHQRRAIGELLAEQGIDCRVGEISDLTFRGGKPYLDGTGIDVILRDLDLEEMLAHPEGEAIMDPVFRAHEEGTVVVWTPTNVFGNKGTLAMLSEFADVEDAPLRQSHSGPPKSFFEATDLFAAHPGVRVAGHESDVPVAEGKEMFGGGPCARPMLGQHGVEYPGRVPFP